MLVDADSAPRPDRQPRVDRQLVLRADAHAEDHYVRRQSPARLQLHGETATIRLEARGRIAQQHGHAVGGQCLGDGRGHFLVQRRQYLVLQLDERCGDAPPHEVLDHFQADETRADDNCLPYAPVDAGLDAVGVLQVSQGEYAGQVNARQRRLDGGRAWGEDQLVVAFLVFASAGQIADAYFLRLAIDGLHRSERADIEVEPLVQPLGGRDQQLPALGDRAAQVIRQAAIGKGDLRAAFEEHDPGVFRQAPRAVPPRTPRPPRRR